jgi:hypothetical protein
MFYHPTEIYCLQPVVSYFYQTENKKKVSHGRNHVIYIPQKITLTKIKHCKIYYLET